MWSRVGQRQSSCLCRACLNAPKTVARRSTTATTRRRKVTATDLFTACYTTILGTAAIIDAQNKEFRKQDLDTKLEKARAAVDNLAAQNAALLSDGAMSSTSGNKPSASTNTMPQFANLDFYQQSLAIYGEQWRHFRPKFPAHDRIDWAALENAIAQEHHDPRVKLVEPDSDRGLYRATKTVITLVDELVDKVESQGQGQRHQAVPTAALISESQDQKQLWQDLREARDSGQLPSFGFPQHDPQSAAETRSSLRESFLMAIEGAATHREMVAKICYNLLVSTVPPSITIYNTLIAGFHRIHRPDLAQSVVNSVLRDTVGPYTEQTTLCLLSHFRSTKNAEGVRSVAIRMRSGDSRTLHLNTLVEPAQNSDAFMGWRHDQELTEEHAVFVEKSPRDQARCDALIESWLSVGKVDRAIKKFVECIRHNVHIDAHLIARLFEDCAIRAERTSVRKLARGIHKHIHTFLRMIQRLVLEVPAAMALGAIDSLCRILEIHYSPSTRDFDGYGLVPLFDFMATFKPWVSAYRIQLQTRLAIFETREVLRIFSLDQPLPEQVESAIKSLSVSKPLLGDMAIWVRAARISGIQSELDTMQKRGAKLSTVIRASIINYKTGMNFDPWGDLESPRWSDRERQLVLADVLEQITLQRSMTSDQVKEELVSKLPDPRQAKAFQLAGISNCLGVGTLRRFYGPKQRQIASAKLLGEAEAMSGNDLELEVDAQIRTTKALIYGTLTRRAHMHLQYQYPDWDQIPLELLVAKHIRESGWRLPIASHVENLHHTLAHRLPSEAPVSSQSSPSHLQTLNKGSDRSTAVHEPKVRPEPPGTTNRDVQMEMNDHNSNSYRCSSTLDQTTPPSHIQIQDRLDQQPQLEDHEDGAHRVGGLLEFDDHGLNTSFEISLDPAQPNENGAERDMQAAVEPSSVQQRPIAEASLSEEEVLIAEEFSSLDEKSETEESLPVEEVRAAEKSSREEEWPEFKRMASFDEHILGKWKPLPAQGIRLWSKDMRWDKRPRTPRGTPMGLTQRQQGPTAPVRQKMGPASHEESKDTTPIREKLSATG